MKVEEIQIALKKNQDIKISLTLIDDINNAYSKGLTLSDISKSLISAQGNVKSAIGMYETALKFTESGMVAAKELGATDTISFLSKKSEMIKVSKKSAESVLSNLSSALSNL